MGFGPFDHFWVTSGSTLYELGGGRIQEELGDKSHVFYVDNRTPELTKEYEGLDCYKYVDQPGGDGKMYRMHYVSSETKIHLNATDPSAYPHECGSGVQGIWYKIWWNGTWYPGNGTRPIPYGGNT
jgi:hypothetical protein